MCPHCPQAPVLLSVCAALLWGGRLRGDPAWMCVLGRNDSPVLSLLPKNLFVCSGTCHESLEKNPVGINPKEWCWFPPHVRNEVLDGTGRILGCILGEYGY